MEKYSKIILALVERKLRSHELEHLKSKAANFQTRLYLLIFPKTRKLADYLKESSIKYDQLLSELYVERPELKEIIRNEKDSFLLIGAPGSGKTTELQRYYLSICKKTITNLSKEKVPVFMSARSVNPDADFVGDTLRLHFKRYSEIREKQLIKYLSNGRVVLFIDGLDEVMEEKRKKLALVLFAFHQKWPNNQLIVSSRTYTSEEDILRLKKLRIRDLSMEERKRFFEIYEQYRART